MRTIIVGSLLVGLVAIPAVAAAAAHSVTVTLGEQNSSGENGKAVLIAEGAKTKVVVNIKHAPARVAQPAHIHDGTCSNLDPKPAFKLNPVRHGKSTTVVPVALDKLLSGKYAINVHKSFKDIKDYVSCGDIAATM